MAVTFFLAVSFILAGSVYHSGITVIMATLLVITLSVNLQVPLYSIYATADGYGSGFVALTFAAYVLGLVPVLIGLGGISGYMGRKQSLLLGLAAAFLANALMTFDANIYTLIAARILQGIAVGVSLGAGTVYLAELLANPRRAAALAGVVITIGLGGGALLTSAALAYQYSTTPLSYPFMASATLICATFMGKMPADRFYHTSNLLRWPHVSLRTLEYCAAIFFAWSMTGIVISSIPEELARLGDTGSWWSGLLVFLAIGTGAVVQPWSRIAGARRSVVAGSILLLFACPLLVLGLWLQSVPLILLATAWSGATSFGFTYLGGLDAVVHADDGDKARVVSGYYLFAYLGLGVPCIFTGYLAEYFGLLSAVGIFSSVIVLATIAILAYISFSKRSVPGTST